MALTYIYWTVPFGEAQVIPPTPGVSGGYSGKIYTANANGVITGVTPGDALYLQPVAGNPLRLVAATGATSDRPTFTAGGISATAGIQGLNNAGPPMPVGLPYWDTTLTKVAFLNAYASGFVDQNGNAV